MTAPRQRIDQLLVARGLFESRAKAQEAVAAGLVTADGAVVRRPSDMVVATASLRAEAPHPWVSRGGLKLDHALDRFRFDPDGRTCLDVGASTGGFTQVLLARGARRVVAVDVGRGQLHPSLRADPRVASLEGTDARALAPSMLPESPALVAVDVSFIPLRLVLPPVAALAAASACLVALIKPQFEAGRGRVRKGVVRDAAVHVEVCDAVERLVRGLGWRVAGVVASPVPGGDGNREFLIGATRGGDA